jgi:hypothetical protein
MPSPILTICPLSTRAFAMARKVRGVVAEEDRVVSSLVLDPGGEQADRSMRRRP